MRSLLALALILTGAWTAGAPARSGSPALRMTFGLGACATLGAALALAGVLHLFPWGLALLGAPTVLAAVRGGLRLPVSPFVRRGVPPAAVPLVMLVAAALVASAAPVVEGDSLSYHMPIFFRMVADDRLAFWPAQWRSAFPQSQELLATVVPLLGGDRPGLVTGLEFVLAAALLVDLGKRWLGDPVHACCAAAIGLAGFAPLSLACSLKPDLLLLDALLSCTIVADSLTRADWRAAAVAGCFAGLMMASKYTGVPLAAAALCFISYQTRTLAAVGAALVGGLAMGGFWYVRNAVVLGNPVPPFLPGLFHSFLSAGALLDFAEHRRTFGTGQTLIDALATPVRMFTSPAHFGGMGNLPNPIALLGLMAPAIPSLRRAARITLPCAALFYVAWFLSLQNPRLLVPVWAWLAVLASGVIGELAARSPTLGRGALGLVAVTAVLSAGFALAWAAPAFADPDAYLDRRTPFHEDVAWMNAHLAAPRTRVATMLNPLGYLRVPWVALDPYVQSEIPPEDLADPARLDAALRRSGVTHVFGAATVLSGDEWTRVRARANVVYRNPASCVSQTHLLRPDPRIETEVLELDSSDSSANRL